MPEGWQGLGGPGARDAKCDDRSRTRMTRRRESDRPTGRSPLPAPAVESAVLANVRRIASLEEDQLRDRTLGERIARVVTRAAGTSELRSMKFEGRKSGTRHRGGGAG
jgi:hypothetical protein